MLRLRRWFPTSLVAMALLALGGCDGPSTSDSVGKVSLDNTPELDGSKDQVSVSGTVTVGGKTATGGDVIFDPKTSSRSDVADVKAPIGKDGTYTAKTYVGTNHISVSAPDMTDQQKAQFTMKIIQPSDSKVDVAIP
jgi:hypothetical protein